MTELINQSIMTEVIVEQPLASPGSAKNYTTVGVRLFFPCPSYM